MIIFKKIRYKNLLSTGNSFTEIELDSVNKTCISGFNGRGKCVHHSTQIDVKFDYILSGNHADYQDDSDNVFSGRRIKPEVIAKPI